ncbi:NAD-dependent glyceraldehyde-3-phosphate dehydrogenase [Dehalobacter sp. UNSWDHB]|jgi:glyceraldehyde 3-phosphate dehydrogenase|uniref:type I glyceraldehyde-3-phosphate dehydrogenase n=1 Tax=unclassified Dehalobacter TaxID=2635733 RepID=UPI00028A77E6|nr:MULTISPECIES: type I glyceraldehyde-3-phosphate dehydrogenase [unclassified Dehalobacter]AFV01623.1 NAD-dependent glyceraldehyde-3-phosphate dehydrogenase [Dehalobacter sp. DCA]AFV04659.1 NAD-dependent glyceraldehyde-3-phosphate dehydrogenase [Dehalobacter sp. CF]EQB21976.1 NAD-dependent glyceraldehyde-3-phosphate dehydrogenase [Dehalobacter sp. UNSWDHB]
MSVKVAINGFGRIGRLCMRALLESSGDLEVVAVNDLGKADMLAHLLKYDSTHGTLPYDVIVEDGVMKVKGSTIKLLAEKNPEELPWKEMGIDVVIESTGRFVDREGAGKHLKAGAKKVVISAPGKDEDITIVMGVNDDKYDPAKHHIISNASCTTNCLAPVAKVIMKEFGIEQGMMTTTHSVTNDQRILDFEHSDWRRARAAFQSMIPTTTGAAKAVALVLPELKGKLNGLAVRVPTPNVSLVDFVVNVSKVTTKEEVNAKLKQAAEGELKGILSYNELPLVSSDYNGNNASSIVDGLSTMVIGDKMVKVLAWYDNESGYSNRVVDVIKMMAARGL